MRKFHHEFTHMMKFFAEPHFKSAIKTFSISYLREDETKLNCRKRGHSLVHLNSDYQAKVRLVSSGRNSGFFSLFQYIYISR